MKTMTSFAKFCCVLPLLMSVAVTAAPPSQNGERKPDKPNILFIIADDQRWDTVGALGNPEISTPNLDALANRGFVFRNAYCMGSMIGAVCTPSRTMLLTGRSLWRIPAWDNKTWTEPTLGSIFRDAGYDTLFVGKRGNSFVAAHEKFETVVYDEERAGAKDRAGSSEFHADTTIDWLKNRNSNRPFLVYFAPPVPHDPRVAPSEFMKMYSAEKITLSKNFMPRHPFDNGELHVRDELLAPHPRPEAEMKRHLAEYYATISCLDHHIGRVLAELRESGQLDKTLVVFTSDQGLAVGGRHGLMGKQNLYEHVKPPLILAGPGIRRGSSDALVYLFDLLPTLCDYSDLPIPEQAEGKSLLPVIAGQQTSIREWLFGAYRDCQRMIRDDRWKLIAYNASGERNTQLFDLANDPDEITNLADDPTHAEQRTRLEKLLVEARKQFGDPVDFDADRQEASKRGPNTVQNGDFATWTNFQKRGVTTTTVGTPPNSLPDGWYGGPGVGGTATYNRFEFADEKNPSGKYFFGVKWATPPSKDWPGETHYQPHFRCTFLEYFGIQDVRIFAGRTVVMSFDARTAKGTLDIIPILWHSYDSASAGIVGVKGKGYELFESSGKPGCVAVTAGIANPAAVCRLTTEWNRFEKEITLPSVEGKSITSGHYTGVGFDLVSRSVESIEIANVEARVVEKE